LDDNQLIHNSLLVWTMQDFGYHLELFKILKVNLQERSYLFPYL